MGPLVSERATQELCQVWVWARHAACRATDFNTCVVPLLMASKEPAVDNAGRTTLGLPAQGAPEVFDIAVVGAGPAGLHAALKSALLFKTCVVFDKGRRHSRIFFAPQVDNIPGRLGVSGRELLKQAEADIRTTEEKLGHRFVDIRHETAVVEAAREPREEEKHPLYVLQAKAKDGTMTTVRARNLVIATGSVDRQPITQDYRRRDIETILPYANKGLADYCLLCDGHLVKDKRVAVIGCGPSAGSVAASLKKNFHADTVLVTCGGLHPDHEEDGPDIPEKTRTFLESRGVPIIEKNVTGWFGLKEGKLGIEFEDGSKEEFDKGWISMGWYSVNSELAVALGAATEADGAVKTDLNCEVLDGNGNGIDGLFAIGDVRAGTWNQIPIGWGEAEMAVVHAFAAHL